MTKRHTAEVHWVRAGQKFVDNRYSRSYLFRFDGGFSVQGSASPHHVPRPYSATDALDPEEAFVASVASCHMLWFLSMAAARGWVVDSYRDAAEGVLGADEAGKPAISLIILRPDTRFGGERPPSVAELMELHHSAHSSCLIANSIRTEVRVEPRVLEVRWPFRT